MFRSIGLKNGFISINKKFSTSLWLKQQQQQFTNIRNRFQFKRFNSSSSSSSTKKKQTGIKALMAQYGYSALGVYLAISCIDFPISFLIVHQVGAEKVKQVQHDVFATVKSWFGIYQQQQQQQQEVEHTTDSGVDTNDHFQLNVKHEPDSELDSESIKPEQTLWESIYSSPLFTEVIVAYALHKSLVFIRVPLTAAITPPLVAKLRSMGYQIGKKEIATFASKAKAKVQGATGGSGLVADKAISEKLGTKATKKQRWWSWFF
ncbi:hypothetical protein WICPIJ_004156 [Wickerhamomyces pijperi]|uniref:DUF1279 domain-containing protein n=1 Tax=Wickerhamomyces pijperi TaxID=599730 RepID=A0A9P8Q655_WICPI|nr:hypothetical protein WICPIJ_004156 [Wickerhamomyces pijperi]